jgi:CRP-like cAMP-binding protein
MSLDSSVLRRVELFAGLDQEALAVVVRHGRTRRFARGAVIFREGEKASTCHVAISGRVRIARSAPDSARLVIRYVGAGEIFGTLALFHGGTYPADATAVTDCVEIGWSEQALRELIERYPRIALNALRIVGQRMNELQDRLRELTAERVEQRVAHALVRLAKQAGKPSERGIEIGFPLLRKDLAAMTGTGHYTVSRILSEWQERGIVASSRKRIIVCNLEALEAVSRAK